MNKHFEHWNPMYTGIKALLTAAVLVIFFGCSTQLPSTPTEIQSFDTYDGTGEATARNLTERYNNLAKDCGAANLAAFLCSGIIFRATKSGRYHAWDPSPSSQISGGVSFSYLRADSKYRELAYGYNNGFIFYPPLQRPEGKLNIHVLCSFPLDADTNNRPNKQGCDYNTNIAEPNTSRECQNQGIMTATQWYAHYISVPAEPRRRHQCGFDVRSGLGAGAVSAFNASLQAMALNATESFTVQNELRLATWPEGVGRTLPLEAFFYFGSGLATAQHDQQDFYNETGGIVVPIILLTLPSTQARDATFVYRAQDQAVLPVSPGKIKPKVPKTYNAAGDHLKMSDIYTDAHVDVEVPHYTGMHATDTIRVRWQGRVNYNSPIIEVGDPPGKRLIPIPRLEVIDNVGRSVEVGYSVKEKGVGETIESDRLTLHIDPQAIDPLPAPIYVDSNSKVAVLYGGETGYTVRVRWTGVVTRDTETQDVKTGFGNVFDIPSAWITENRGKTVLINYSIVRKNSTEQRMFSQVLRINL
ncbi:hypothetical protein [Pseudomonas sp. NFACC39-1]|uniref:hypothetical protein n=1 Tax=Pseudomonas sp. NFACC39-1 TaxID=1566195 RepID=UPI0008C0F4A0|nr:hypothetical protein [Pseudomonas sp. NFACC39-1]SEO75804.1 hypothetical protein SAMN03159293_03865 [Pseudomonas sp. NFACC39-1]